jgi:hypothetical protein
MSRKLDGTDRCQRGMEDRAGKTSDHFHSIHYPPQPDASPTGEFAGPAQRHLVAWIVTIWSGHGP